MTTPTPYASTLLAEVDKLNDELRVMRETVSTLVDQLDAARRERDAEREARAASATSFAFTIAARGLADHPWQEYNAHGYLCHYPGCQLTPDEHAEFVPRLTPFASGGPVRGPGSRDDDRVPFQPAGCLHSEICRECRAE